MAEASSTEIAVNTPGGNSLSPTLSKVFKGLNGLPQRNKVALMAGIPLLIALIVSAFLWSKDASYKVLFSNVSDADGGAIIASLNQMNVPYHFGANGSTILVPMDKVHDTRLKLASQGLPKGSVVGFELLENQKLGITQFQEQVNYQRALEGELARSIQSMGSVQTARVHLAIPKPSIFLREQQKPTASVVVTLFGGRVLDKSQIQGIVHLVASSVPDMTPKNVSIVDQTGSLLTNNDGGQMSDATQLSYVHQIEQSYNKRVIDILVPLFGADNVKATVTADVDFSQVESTEESYKPNGDIKDASIRSQQINESSNASGTNPQGIPGTLSNQPPGAATAAIGGNPQAGLNGAAPAAGSQNNSSKASTINYELDKSVKYTKGQIGQIKRVSAAVVVNHKTVTSPKGETKTVPLTPEETEQIGSLVREAIGFNKERGDTVNVVNQLFTKVDDKAPAIWQDPDMLDLVKSFGLPLGVAAATGLLVFGLFKPLLKGGPVEPAGASNATPRSGQLLSTSIGEDDAQMLAQIAQEEQLALPGVETPRDQRMIELRKLAKENPQLVANVLKEWVTGE